MSDDGYFYDDEGEDFDADLFWNDDGANMLADDLAEHAFPSPVYAEDPAYEVMGGYSDWEYYSDDYYDDDPSLLKDNLQQGSPVKRSQTKKLSGPQRGKKRKLAATRDIPDLSLDQEAKDELPDMRSSFKGTVWRSLTPRREEKELYQSGMGDRVALLENWREVFKMSQPFGKNGRKSPLSHHQSSHDSLQTRVGPRWTGLKLSEDELMVDAADGLELEDDLLEPREAKRRRVSSTKHANFLPKHKVVVEIPAPGLNGIGHHKQSIEEETTPIPLSSRKRKAKDVEQGDSSEGPLRPTAKRVASGKGALKAKDKEKPPPLATKRVTRSKKK